MSDFLRDGELVYTLNERGTNEVYFAVYGPDRETEAERIRLALNSHAVLLAALEALADSASMLDVEFCDDEEQAEAEALLGRARAAIARARGGKS